MRNPIAAVVRQKLNDLDLRKKFLFTYAVLLILPFCLISAIYIKASSQSVESQSEKIIAQNAKQVSVYIEYRIKEVENQANSLLSNTTLQDILVRELGEPYPQYEEYLYIQGIMNQIRRLELVRDIRVYVAGQRTYTRGEDTSIYPMSRLRDDPVMVEMLETKRMFGWSEPYELQDRYGNKEKMISYVLLFPDVSDISKYSGALRIDLAESAIGGLIGQAYSGGDEAQVYMTSKGGELLTDAGKGGAELPRPLSSAEAAGSYEVVSRGKTYSVMYSAVGETGLMLVYMVQTSIFSRESSRIAMITMTTMLILLLISVAAAVVISGRITLRMRKLRQRMNRVDDLLESPEQTDVHKRYAQDEAGRLQEAFEQMVVRLRQVIQDNYVAQIEKKEARLNMLQAQINPHLLYNALDQINWVAIGIRANEISEMTTDLGQFYRIALNNGKDLITLEEEVEHVRLFVQIQKHRLGSKLQVVVHVPEAHRRLIVIKLLLQPLVENAIKHGILQKSDMAGIIEIESVADGADLVVRVKDDAGLLDADRVRRVIEGSTEAASSGYGVKNVNERLQMYYGEGRGLRFYLDERGYSTFEIRIPTDFANSADQ